MFELLVAPFADRALGRSPLLTSRPSLVRAAAIGGEDTVFREVLPVDRLTGFRTGTELVRYRNACDAEARGALDRQVFRLASRIHTRIPLPKTAYMVGFVREFLDRLARTGPLLQSAGVPSGTIYATFEQRASAEAIRHAGVTRIHGDFRITCLYFDGEELAGFADNQSASVGSPYEDLARYLRSTGDEDSTPSLVASAYGSAIHADTLSAFVIADAVREIDESGTPAPGPVQQLRRLVSGARM
jgi:hypothetical protein